MIKDGQWFQFLKEKFGTKICDAKLKAGTFIGLTSKELITLIKGKFIDNLILLVNLA